MDVQSEGEQLTPICPYLGFWRDFDALPEHIRASVRQVVRDISKGPFATHLSMNCQLNLEEPQRFRWRGNGWVLEWYLDHFEPSPSGVRALITKLEARGTKRTRGSR